MASVEIKKMSVSQESMFYVILFSIENATDDLGSKNKGQTIALQQTESLNVIKV